MIVDVNLCISEESDMKKLSFRETQLGAYEILKFIDRVCREQGIQYFLMYGSLIGAIRDKGIIPWDDDIDVMMPRPDYDRFMDYCKKNQKIISPFKLFEKTLVPDYPHPIARMSDMRYYIVFENEKDYGIGLFVDIYPLDGVGNDIGKARALVHASYRNASLCFLTSRKKFGVDNTATKLRLLAKIPAYIWARIMGNEHYYNKSKKLCLRYSYSESRYVSGVAQPWREKKKENKNIYDKEWFEPIEAQFEDGIFYIPKNYDKILTMGYGDYMTPLPENQRHTHHTYDTYERECNL